MNPIIWWIRSSFQSVQDMGSDSLVQQLAQKPGHVLLLDVRSAANEGKPIVDSGGMPTPLVHPYSAVWSYLLQPEFRAKI